MSAGPPPYPPPPPIATRGWAYAPGPRVTRPGPWVTSLRRALAAVDAGVAAPGRVLLLAIVVGVAAVGALGAGIPGAGLTLFVLGLAAAAFRVGSPPARQSRLLAIAAVALAVGFSTSASIWVDCLCSCGAFACLNVAASLARGGSLFDLPWVEVSARVYAGVWHAVVTVPWLGRGSIALMRTRATPRRRAVLRGLAIAAPLVTILAGILAAGDPLFAAIFRINLDAGQIAVDVGLFLLGACLVGLLLRVASVGGPPARASERTARNPKGIEAIVILSALTCLFAVYTSTQVAGALGAGREVLVQQGMSYSEYARSGYFQLIAVVVITTLVLPLFRETAAASSPHRKWVRVLSSIVVLLTIGIGAVALRRLALYDGTYGLTMLRLGSAVGAAWFALLLLLLGASLLGVGRRRAWFPGAAFLSLVVFIGAFTALNPESYVARYDVGRANVIGLDVAYLSSLADDAVPDLVASLPSLDASTSASLRHALCARPIEHVTWATWSVSHARASAALATICPERG